MRGGKVGSSREGEGKISTAQVGHFNHWYHKAEQISWDVETRYEMTNLAERLHILS